MFDILAKLLSSITSFLFPLFASYKALKTTDPAQLTPWLMYWVVLACALLVESWTEWFLVWIPLYPYLRLLFFLYLVLPQTQGARIIYTTYVYPYLEENESQIEDLIATTHDRMKVAGMAYLKRAIELLRTQVFGMPPSPDAQQSDSDKGPASQRPKSYTQALLDRFQLPQTRWSDNGGSTGQEFYNFLTGAVNAAAAAMSDTTPSGAAGSSGTAGAKEASSSPFSSSSAGGVGIGAFPSGDLTASGTLIPSNIRDDADKMNFLVAQRERLNFVLSALDREAASIRSGPKSPTPAQDVSLDDVEPPTAQSTERPATSHSGKSTGGLSKSRSEVDFEKIEAESGAEDNSADKEPESAKATPAASGGSWLPWGWGASSPSAGDAAKDKAE